MKLEIYNKTDKKFIGTSYDYDSLEIRNLHLNYNEGAFATDSSVTDGIEIIDLGIDYKDKPTFDYNKPIFKNIGVAPLKDSYPEMPMMLFDEKIEDYELRLQEWNTAKQAIDDEFEIVLNKFKQAELENSNKFVQMNEQYIAAKAQYETDLANWEANPPHITKEVTKYRTITSEEETQAERQYIRLQKVHAENELYVTSSQGNVFDADKIARQNISDAILSSSISGITELHINDLPEGQYALAIYHDENGNDELDTNWLGIPKEPIGFSNSKMRTFGPPGFEDCAFLF